jgi:hypothetical protein
LDGDEARLLPHQLLDDLDHLAEIASSLIGPTLFTPKPSSDGAGEKEEGQDGSARPAMKVAPNHLPAVTTSLIPAW